MNIKIIKLSLIFLFLILKSYANDGAYSIGPQGGSIYPINNKYIQMLKEIVIYDEIKGQFSTTFVFYNTSDSVQQVTFGFPVFPTENSEDMYDDVIVSKQKQIEEIKRKLQFKTWVDNKKILREVWAIDTTDDYRFAFVMTISFQPKETKTILNKFKQGFGYGGDNMGRGWKNVNYILKSGKGWKGVIKNVKIIFKMNTEEDLGLSSNIGVTKEFLQGLDNFYGYRLIKTKNGWTFSPNPTNINYNKKIITWEFVDLEPNFNISLSKKENDFEIIRRFDFLEYLDTLSSFIVLNDTLKFNKYYNTLKTKKDLFKVKKEYCKMLYDKYGEDFLKKHQQDDFSKFTNKTRHIINAYAALNDYEFSNEMWFKMFQLFDWYTPNTKKAKYCLIQKTNIDNLLSFEKGDFFVPIVVKSENKIQQIDNKKNEGKINHKENEGKIDVNREGNNLYYILAFIFILLGGMIMFLKVKKKKTNT